MKKPPKIIDRDFLDRLCCAKCGRIFGTPNGVRCHYGKMHRFAANRRKRK